MALNGAGSHGRVYRVAEAHILLIHTPKLWVRRSLLVRGRLDGCSPAPAPCSIWQPRLFDPDQPTVRTALPIERAADTRGLFLQTLLAYLFPKARLPQWGSLGAGWSGWGGKWARECDMGEERREFGRRWCAGPLVSVAVQACPGAEPSADAPDGVLPHQMGR
jgi:hypothetical protein